MRKCKPHTTDVLIVFLIDFSVVSDVSGVIWEEWWTYDGISGESNYANIRKQFQLQPQYNHRTTHIKHKQIESV